MTSFLLKDTALNIGGKITKDTQSIILEFYYKTNSESTFGPIPPLGLCQNTAKMYMYSTMNE